MNGEQYCVTIKGPGFEVSCLEPTPVDHCCDPRDLGFALGGALSMATSHIPRMEFALAVAVDWVLEDRGQNSDADYAKCHDAFYEAAENVIAWWDKHDREQVKGKDSD